MQTMLPSEINQVRLLRKKLIESSRRFLNHGHRDRISITHYEIKTLCNAAKESFLKQKALLKISAPIKICGDIHGQFYDLVKLFKLGGSPSRSRYLFLGDYVDRGDNSLEVICLLLCLKVLYPKLVYLLRGNHEIASMNSSYGFMDEIRKRFRAHRRIFDMFNEVFEYMPLAAVVGKKIFCCHGGLGPELLGVEQIERLTRPIKIPEAGFITDLVWSDPDAKLKASFESMRPKKKRSHRNAGHLFGVKGLEVFLENTNLKMIVRAHQCVKEGYEWLFDDRLLTIFSAPNYTGKRNTAAFLYVEKFGHSIVQFK